MSDEFDDSVWPSPPLPRVADEGASHRTASAVPAFIARAYAEGDPSLRAKLLECLTRPLSVLSLAAVAAGAFAQQALVGGGSGTAFAADDLARFSSEQILELVRFVEQVSPQALHQCAALIAMVL